jgi:hypothetical protein
MTDKNLGGRPKKYASDAERKKAYRQRKKEKMEKLEKRVSVLEKILSKHQIDLETAIEEIEEDDLPHETALIKLTPDEISNLNSKKIIEYLAAYEKNNSLILGNSIKNILKKSGIKINLKNSEAKQNFSELEENIQQQILIYLMRAELEKRQRLDEGKKELDLLEKEIEELEKQATKAKIEKLAKSG